MIRRKRKKAWIGAVIQGVGGIVSGIFNRNAQKEAERQKKIRQNRADALEEANALTQAYSDQSYADEFQKKIVGKCGGNFKNDRIRRAKKFKCGGRYKYSAGGDLVANIFAAGQIQQYTHDDGSTSVKTNVKPALKKKKVEQKPDTLPNMATSDTPTTVAQPIVDTNSDVINTNNQQQTQTNNQKQEQQNNNTEQQQQKQKGNSGATEEAISAGINTAVNLITQNNQYDNGENIRPTVQPALKRKTYDRLQQAKFGKRIYLK